MKKNMKVLSSLLIGSSIIIAVGFSPMLALAERNENGNKNKIETKIEVKKHLKKEDKEDRNDKREENDDSKENKGRFSGISCAKAFGHLVSLGWIKQSDLLNQVSAFDRENCFLPFGIYKKIASSTPDNIAPIISNIETTSGLKKVTIKWSTNEKSDSTVYYGTTPSIDTNSSTTPSAKTRGMTLNHSVKINGLLASTTYYAIVKSVDRAGNVTKSSTISFSTKGSVVINDTTPPIISNVTVTAGASLINASWQTNEPSTSKVFYKAGTTIDINSSTTPFVQNNNLLTSHSFPISGLATSTTHSIIIESRDNLGNISRTGLLQITTSN